MVNIPSRIATKKDLENLQNLAVNNQIDRAQWIKKLKRLLEKQFFSMPVISKTDKYIIIPYTEYAIMDKNEILSADIENEPEKKQIKIYISNFKEPYYMIDNGYPQLVKLKISNNEIEQMIKELI